MTDDDVKLSRVRLHVQAVAGHLGPAMTEAESIGDRKLRWQAFDAIRELVQEALRAELWFENEEANGRT